MAYKTCENCGSIVFNLGCMNCNEMDYIEEQAHFDSLPEHYEYSGDIDSFKGDINDINK